MEKASHVVDSMSTFLQSVGDEAPQDDSLRRMVEILRAGGGSMPSLEVLRKLEVGPAEFARASRVGEEAGLLKVVVTQDEERLELI